MTSNSDENKHAIDPVHHVRMRPGMYFGGVDKRALHEMVFNLVDNALTDIQAGLADSIWITLRDGFEISIRDNGKGMPVDRVEPDGKLALEIAMTGFMRRGAKGEYLFNVGIIGGSILVSVNALSAEATVESAREGYLWQQRYIKGVRQTDVVQIRPLNQDESTGTTITFTPDFTILEAHEFDYELLCNRAYELAMLLPGATFTVRDERQQQTSEQVYRFENGLLDYVSDLSNDLKKLHTPVYGKEVLELPKEHQSRDGYELVVEFAFVYTDADESYIRTYGNTTATTGGTHLLGFYNGLLNVIRQYSSYPHLEHDHLQSGLAAVIRFQHPYITFESQWQIKLMNSEATAITENAVTQILAEFARQNPEAMQLIVKRVERNVGMLRGKD